MTSVPDCLAIFSVSALANDEAAVANATQAIDRFVAERSNHPSGALAALYELRAAFIDLRLDCTAGTAILDELHKRIGDPGPPAQQIDGRSGEAPCDASPNKGRHAASR
jgi:hypothetical protein